MIQQNPGLQGFNITIPYKESVLQFLDKSNELVVQTEACNCIKIIDGELIGFNTDVIGFERSLLNKLKPYQTNALILGTGGASKAVEFVLTKNGIHFTKISRQHSEKGLTYAELTPDFIKENLLIVNTSPVGMYPHSDELPDLPYESITPRHFLFDLIYNPEKTLFLKRGEEKGATIQNGYDMLITQAEESWRTWNDPEAD
jgi:shikimate dehydrogenase